MPAMNVQETTTITYPGAMGNGMAATHSYRNLLLKIACEMGLSYTDADALIAGIYKGNPVLHENEHLRLSALKVVVHSCVVRVSRVLFDLCGSGNRVDGMKENCIVPTRVSAQPLTVRVVYVLNRNGYTETEIAWLLNTSVVEVRERLSKANIMR